MEESIRTSSSSRVYEAFAKAQESFRTFEENRPPRGKIFGEPSAQPTQSTSTESRFKEPRGEPIRLPFTGAFYSQYVRETNPLNIGQGRGSRRDISEVFYDAIERNDLEMVQEIMLQPIMNINREFGRRGHIRQSPVNFAASKGHWNLVHLLMTHPKFICTSADLYQILDLWPHPELGELKPFVQRQLKARNDSTPLFKAAQEGNLKVLQLLLQMPDIDINGRTLFEGGILELAFNNGHRQAVELIVTSQRDSIEISSTQDYFHSESILTAAVRNGDLPLLKLLLECPKVNPNILTRCHTVLEIAFENNQWEIIKLLLSCDRTRPEFSEPVFRSLLLGCCMKNQLEIVKLILNHPLFDCRKVLKPLFFSKRDFYRPQHLPSLKILLSSSKIGLSLFKQEPPIGSDIHFDEDSSGYFMEALLLFVEHPQFAELPTLQEKLKEGFYLYYAINALYQKGTPNQILRLIRSPYFLNADLKKPFKGALTSFDPSRKELIFASYWFYQTHLYPYRKLAPLSDRSGLERAINSSNDWGELSKQLNPSISRSYNELGETLAMHHAVGSYGTAYWLAAMVLLSDEYLRFTPANNSPSQIPNAEEVKQNSTRRFLSISQRLPYELQRQLSNVVSEQLAVVENFSKRFFTPCSKDLLMKLSSSR
jgi:hypothetical protein